MKTAIYIEDGVVQLVITPESEFEKSAVKAFGQSGVTCKVFSGAFYDCRGGWIRQKPYYQPSAYGDSNDSSVIIRVASERPAIPEN